MKRKELKVAVCLLAGTMLATSCVGSFTMFSKLAKWNRRATDSKFLNELIFILKNGYEITRPDGSVFYLTYNKEENNWYMNENGKENKLIHFNENGTIKAFLNNGMTMDVTPDAAGVYELRQAVAGTSYFMATR